jgi:hypothetical protein
MTCNRAFGKPSNIFGLPARAKPTGKGVKPGKRIAGRYQVLLLRLLRERLYDGACLLLSTRDGGKRGESSEHSLELSFQQFSSSLMAHVIAYLKSRA